MARRVFFHVGTLKTGTTYLQRVMWENREALRGAGVLVPGDEYSDRVWSTRTVRGMDAPHERAGTAWERLVGQVNGFAGDAVVSHEFFGGASREQARAALARFGDAEMHVVVTTRDLVGILPAFWQEQVKFGHTGRFADYEPLPYDAPPSAHWSWRTIDAADVLDRWAADLPPERVHVITMPPPGSPKDLLWRRFAEVCGFDPAVASLDLPAVNESMGVPECELLRRVNEGVHDEIKPPPEPSRWLRGYLGLQVLAARDSEKLRVTPERAARLREQGQQIVERLSQRGYHVVGDLADIVGPEDPPTSRQPEEVGDAELLQVALDTINTMLVDHRRLTHERTAVRHRFKAFRARAAEDLAAARAQTAAAREAATPRGIARRAVRRVLHPRR